MSATPLDVDERKVAVISPDVSPEASDDAPRDAPEGPRDSSRELSPELAAMQVRDRLVEVTMAMLEADGEQALRVVEVSEAANVSMGTIYSHFENRRGLVAAVRLEQYRRWVSEGIDALRVALEGMDGPEGALGAMSQFVIVPDDPGPRAHREVRVDAISASHHEPALADAMQQMHRELHARATELVERAQQVGILDPALDPGAVALLLQAVPMGLVVADLDPETAPSAEAWITLMLRVAGSLAAPAPAEDQP